MSRPNKPTGWRWALYHLNPFWLYRTYWSEVVLGCLVASFFVVLLWSEVVVPIRSGERGVYWSRFFGGTLDWVIGEGTVLKFPWDVVAIYNVRHQAIDQETNLLTSDGMAFGVTWFVRFRPEIEDLPHLHRTYGPDYPQSLVVHEVVAALREVLGNYRADQIYVESEAGLAAKIAKDVDERLDGCSVDVEGLGILKLQFPPRMAAAIVDKLREEQRLQSYNFRIPAEVAEANRRQIEAYGLRRFQYFSGIDPLKWRGVAATVELSKSQNTKIVLLGTDSKELPIILNTEPSTVLPRLSSAGAGAGAGAGGGALDPVPSPGPTPIPDEDPSPPPER